MLLSIDDHPIASDGNVELEGERVEMPEIVERKFKGDKVKLDLLRKQPAMSVRRSSWARFGHISSRVTATICGRVTCFTAACFSSR